MPPTVFQRIESLLQDHHVVFDVLRHSAVFTSEEAALVRGTSLASGAKALICRTGNAMNMFVLPANRKLNSKAVRKLGFRDVRFATREEVLQLTGLTPGSIPPFGHLFGIATWCEQTMHEIERINFNAGDHSTSVSMRFDDYLIVEKPTLASIAE